MQIERSNHSNEADQLFGLLPARLVCVAGPEHKVPDRVEVTGANKAFEKAEEALGEDKEAVTKEIDKYNRPPKTNANFENWPRERKENRPFMEPIKFDADNPQKTIAQIDRILTTPYQVIVHPATLPPEKEWHTLMTPEPKNSDRSAALIELRWKLVKSTNVFNENLVTAEYKDDEEDVARVFNEYYVDKILFKYFLEMTPAGERTLNAEGTSLKTDILAKLNDASLDDRSKFEQAADVIRTYLNANPDAELKDLRRLYAQFQFKARLLSDFVAYEDTVSYTDSFEAYRTFETASNHAHGERLNTNMRIVEKSEERIGQWQGRPTYEQVRANFDLMRGDSIFEEFGLMPSGDYSPTLRRQSEQLFIAILAHETDNFTEDYVEIIGEGFGEDHEENKKRFPYLYNEWLAYHGINKEEHDAKLNAVVEVERRIEEEHIGSMEQIINGVTAAGIDYRSIAALEKQPQYEYYKNLEKELQHRIVVLEQKVAEGEGDTESFSRAADALTIYKQWAREQWRYYHVLRSTEEVYLEFTRAELSKPTNRTLVMKLLMQKYLKSMKMVDEVMNEHGSWMLNYHPEVRRVMIADLYRSGVSQYRNVIMEDGTVIPVYQEDTRDDIRWMLSEITQSDYFNRNEVGRHLDEPHREVLLVARMANTVIMDLNNVLEAQKVIKTIIKFKNGEATQEQFDALQPREFIEKLNRKDAGTLQGHLTELQAKETHYREFIEAAKEALEDPYSDKTKRLITAIENGTYEGIISPDMLNKFRYDMEQISTVNYHALDLESHSRMKYLDRLGISVEGMYEAYKLAIQESPEMDVNNWDRMFLSDDKATFMKLSGFLDTILTDSKTQGKEDFLVVFNTLHGFGRLEALPNTRDDQAAAIAIYAMLKEEVENRQEIATADVLADAERQAMLDGMTIGDRMEEGARSVIDMLIGPGQSWTNRAAGLVVVIAAWKLAKKAIKGEGKGATALRVGFLALATELVVKKMTGRGVLEHAGIVDALAVEIEGTYKAVLVQRGAEYMKQKEIDKTAHTAALYELDKVPFHEALEWYNNSHEGVLKRKDGPQFPGRIDTSMIMRGDYSYEVQDEELMAKRIVWHTMHNFFEYVGAKEGKTANEGMLMLQDRWVDAMRDPNHELPYSELLLAQPLMEEFRSNPNRLTWKIVMESEIDPQHVEETKRQEGMAPILDYALEQGRALETWTRVQLGSLGGVASEFFDDLGIHSEMAMEFLGDLGEAGGRKLHFAKERVSFWYGNHQYEIRRFAGMHWELLMTGLKLPFQMIYHADMLAIPWTLLRLQQFETIVLDPDVDTIKGDLTAADIMPTTPGIDLTKPEENPMLRRFGVYQPYFAQAFNAGHEVGGKREGMFFRGLPSDPIADGVGFYIQETSFEDAYINPAAGGTPASRIDQMQEKAWQQARDFYKTQNIPAAAIDKYMYPIHIFLREGEPNPPKIYTFWYMPMSDSREYMMKESGNWTDYENPRKHRERGPFIPDPTKSDWENLQDAYTQDLTVARVAAATVGPYAAQALRLFINTGEVTGDVIVLIARVLYPKKPPSDFDHLKDMLELDKDKQQVLDEFFASAKNRSLAISDFYHEEKNSDMYAALLDYAHERAHALYLGIFDGETDYESGAYKNRPRGWAGYTAFESWLTTWETKNSKTIDPHYKQKIRREAAAGR
ncbi:hypothetical protein KJ742_02845 [Patescibacteria group bacterium]|nr:hypothetical protein [Patescibacteria group bacterium]